MHQKGVCEHVDKIRQLLAYSKLRKIAGKQTRQHSVACLIYNVCTYFCTAAIMAGALQLLAALIGKLESSTCTCEPFHPPLSESIFLQLLILTNYFPINQFIQLSDRLLTLIDQSYKKLISPNYCFVIVKGRCHCFCGEVLFCRKANITILGFTLWQYSDGAVYWRGNLDWSCQYWYSNLDVCPRKEIFPILQFLSSLYSESAAVGFSYSWQITSFQTNF